MKPRIAIFIPRLAAGGVLRCFFLLAQGFVHKNIDVDIIAGQAGGPFREQTPAQVNLIDLHSAQVHSALPGLIHYLKRSKPVALLSGQTHANIIAAWACKLSRQKIRLVVSEHNDMLSVVKSAGMGKDRLRPLMARLFYPWAQEIVAVSNGVARSLIDLTGIDNSRIHVIPNPIIPENLDLLKSAPCPHPWLANLDIPVILSAGRLEKQKDFPTLIQAINEVRSKRTVRLIILGEGSKRKTLEALIDQLDLQSIVDLPGYVDNIYTYMYHSSVFVLSSAWEGFANVLVEAMACEIPVISTNCPSGPSEILEDGRFGCLVPVGNPDSMASAIINILDHPINVSQARIRAGQFSVERAVAKYLQLLLER